MTGGNKMSFTLTDFDLLVVFRAGNSQVKVKLTDVLWHNIRSCQSAWKLLQKPEFNTEV